MLERLLELLLSAKSGVIAGVFLIGTTGVLVTATVQNGVTTITVTQASQSPSSSESPDPTSTATASPSPSPSPSHSPSSSPSSSASANACSQEAHEINAAVQRVDRAFSKFHTDLGDLSRAVRSDAARATAEKADKLLKAIRQNAVEAIHDTKSCAGRDDDEDENDQDEDNDESSQSGNPLLALLSRLFGGNVNVVTTTASPTPTSATATAPTVVTLATGDDPETIADNAIAAMQLVFDTAKHDLAALPTASPRPARTAEPSDRRGSGKDSKEHKGGSD